MMRRLMILAACLGPLMGLPAEAALAPADMRPEAPIVRSVIRAPGDPARPIMLNVTVLKPPGAGPFPLAVFNHGSDGAGWSQDMSDYDNQMATYYFFSRGYAVALPLMRGYGGSGGRITAASRDLAGLGQGDARDILATLGEIAKDPAIDARRIVMAGGSFGGWNSLGVASLNDPRVAAIVNFYGGVRTPRCGDGDGALTRGARIFGSTSRAPSIWFYGDNDALFAKPLWQAMHRGYVDAGGRAELVAFGPFRANSHKLLGAPDSLPVFAPALDAFLAKLGLPAQTVHAEYLPLSPPPPSRYAKVDDLDAVPFLSDAGRDMYRKFLTEPLPRVFVIALGKGSLFQSGGFDPIGRGLRVCRDKGVTCRIYAFNEDVVWTYPTPAPPPTHFAPLDDVAALPVVNDKGRDGYRKFLTLKLPRAFAIAPDGQWAYVAEDQDPVAKVLASCGRTGARCRPYAVDREVVWPEGGIKPPVALRPSSSALAHAHDEE